ncbi:hypothetical protein [Sphingobium limneticum]|uniref:Uncharacterized protein n=1 Tax=Sphingobium limneticum TaxID=1007511 RepID=A0A5J5IA24_9SPHN|nr:hypothetical protein [Sphingobium limneticum]KAA9020758.1 hypothetical protein F4U96_03580 [Sphingobium limneticum]KAA9033084.1 hypothetical protein F4U95_03580 [Sphingobium limneticum]
MSQKPATDAELWQQSEATCSAQYDKLSAKHDDALAHLSRLADAEAHYRKSHDLYGSDDRRTGRAWDEMRHAGDAARALILSSFVAPEAEGES